MWKLYSVTPNPALDLSGHVTDIVPNEKNYVHSQRIDAGGNGINSARIATRLGTPCITLGFLGGPVGVQIKHILNSEKIPTDFTKISQNTRTNVTVTNDCNHLQTRLTFPGPIVNQNEARALLKKVGRLKGPGILILGGSIPKGCPTDFHFQIVKSAHKQNLFCIADLPSTPLKQLLRKLNFRLLLIKPNQTELEEYFEKKFRSDDEIAAAAKRLLPKSQIVCVSLGERGAIYATDFGTWMARSPKIKARGTVGAGDSMVGAMASCLARSKKFDLVTLTDLMSWGVAAGAATAASEGTAQASKAEIRSLKTIIEISNILIQNQNTQL